MPESGEGTRPGEAGGDCCRTKPHPSKPEQESTSGSGKQSAKAAQCLRVSSVSPRVQHIPDSHDPASDESSFEGNGFPTIRFHDLARRLREQKVGKALWNMTTYGTHKHRCAMNAFQPPWTSTRSTSRRVNVERSPRRWKWCVRVRVPKHQIPLFSRMLERK